MAESNQRKFAEPIDLDDQDPFAELTRIMGFDPRVAAKAQPRENPAPAANEDLAPTLRAAPAVAYPAKVAPVVVAPVAPRAAEPVPAVAPEAHDDFGIDLEKELLGEFAEPDVVEPAAWQPSSTDTDATTREAPQDEFDGAFEQAFTALGHEDARGTTFTPSHLTADGAAHVGDDLAAEFDFSEFDLDEPSAQTTPVQAPAIEEPEPAVDLDLADLRFDYPPQPNPESAARLAREEHSEPLLDLSFDDLALDDTAPEPVTSEKPEFAPAIARAAGPAPEFDLASFDFNEPARPFAAVPIEPVADRREPKPAAGEMPAHDGFAEVDMDFGAAFDRQFASSEPAEGQSYQTDDPVDIWNVQPAPRVSEPPAPVELSLEDELDALLRDEPPRATQPAAATPRPLHAPFSYESRWAALEADEEHAPARQNIAAAAPVAAAESDRDQRRPYSDPSLIARLASFQAPQRGTDDLDDLLDAMEHEVHGEPTPAPVEAGPEEHRLPGDPASAEHAEITYDQPDGRALAAESANMFEGYEEEAAAAYGAAPEIETVEVPEAAVAVAHDLDIPELAYEEEKPQVSAYGDIEADFAAVFQESKPSEEPVNQFVGGGERPTKRPDFDADFEALYNQSYADAGRSGRVHEGTVIPFQPAAAGHRQAAPQPRDHDDFDVAAQPAAGGRDRFVDLDFDSDFDDDGAQGPVTHVAAASEPRRGRGLLIAAIVGGVAVLGGVGALALSLGGGEGTDAPALVKADDSPIKVKPENPGGTTVPNQDNKVYDAVKGSAAATDGPTQEKLVTTSEEPVDMAAVTDNGPLPGVNADEDIPQTAESLVPKAEDRIEPAAEESAEESVVVAPRKVKTMIVRADGTLVPREEPAPAADDSTGAVAIGDAAPTGAAVPGQPVKTGSSDTAAATPKASALPPVKKTADAKPDTVAAVEPAEPTASAAGAWSVQIASQPSAEAAKSTYEDLAKRYAGVIGGKGVNIVKAEIAGKGTYWRVRVPAASRDEAVKLCGDYKSAGGNCFISK